MRSSLNHLAKRFFSLNRLLLLAGVSVIALSACAASSKGGAQANVTPDEAYAISKEAYVYTYPMVENYYTIYQYFVDKENSQYKGPINEISNIARVFTPKDTTIITPNSDTPYSYLTLDLRAEPYVLTLPAIEKNRYYSVQIVDLYTSNVDYLGTREDGNNGGNFLITAPGWKGTVPQGIKRVVEVPTEFAFILYRTQLLNDADLERVKAIQSQYGVQPLNRYEGKSRSPVAPKVNFPKIERGLIDENYWSYADFLLQFSPPIAGEEKVRQSFERIGLGESSAWNASSFSPEVLAAIERGRKDAHQEIATAAASLTSSGGLFGTPKEMSAKRFNRAVGAMGGIYGNSQEEAFYPIYLVDEKNQPIDTSKYNYTMTFARDQLPPVDAFWSLTMYDGKTKLLVDNPLNRYLINSAMLPNLKRNADGGITIYIQAKSPGKALESNWLPAANAPIGLVMRLYLPKESVFNGGWEKPSIKIASDLK